MLIDESQLINWSTATSIWDTMMDCQVGYAELSVNHLVTRRPSRSKHLMLIEFSLYSQGYYLEECLASLAV